MTIFVTGGSGHLGANLLRRLATGTERVVALERSGSDNRALDGLPIERGEGDLRDLEAVRRAVRGARRVYHCAAKVSTTAGGEREIYDCNVVGTRNLLLAAREAGVERVVVTSSFSAVGHTDGRPADERDAFYPFEEHMPYERSKAWVEHECLKAVAGGLDVVIATSCAILGPADFKPSRMGRVVRDFANGKMRAYIPGGFEFVAARDIVEGHLLAMERGKTGEKYIFSTRFVTVDELVAILERVTGKPRPAIRLPAEVMAPIAAASSFVLTRFFPDVPQRFTPGAVRILRMGRRADTGKAQRELGYRPTSIEDALREAYESFVERGEIEGVARRPRALAPELPGGVPWLGHAIDFWRNPIDLLTRGRERFGEAFRFHLAGKDVTVLTGPAASKAFFHAPTAVLSPRECYQFTVPVFGPGVAYDVPTEVMDQQLAWLHPALSDKRLRTYARVMSEEAELFLDAWGERGEVDLFDATNQLTTYIATRCLLGEEVRRHLTADFARLYHDLDRGMSLVAYFAPNAPLPAFKKRDRAREEVERLLSRVMADRRAEEGSREHEDFLQTLMDARYEDGSTLPDHVIAGLLLTLIFAGQHTSAVLAAWAGILLHQNRRYLPPILAELDEVLGDGGEPSIERIRRLTLLERAIKEAERLRPPLVMLMRMVLEDMEYGGFTLPKGSLAMVSPAVSHRLSDVFASPDAFDPDRYAPGREEDKRALYSLIGFGGGKHRCLGMVFAYQQVKVIWASILRRFDIELVEPDYRPNYTTFVVGPHQPCRIRYRRRARVAVSAASTTLAGATP